MTPERRATRDAAYDRGVFINCPFDDAYRPMFDAIVFAVSVCGLEPHAALEIDNASLTRLDKIGALIGSCRWGIHDISRVALNEHGLPRFNMPFELGLFFGAKRFGSPMQRRKSCLVFDTEPFRYQRFISDISGQDITPHDNDVPRAIGAVRGWLSDSLPYDGRTIPGGMAIVRLYGDFQAALPGLCAQSRVTAPELTFVDRVRMGVAWLQATAQIERG